MSGVLNIGNRGEFAITDDMLGKLENKFLKFNTGDTFYFLYDSANPPSQYMLEQIYNAVKYGNTELLLNLAMKNNRASGVGEAAIGQITCTVDPNTGALSYKISSNVSVTNSSASVMGAIEHLNAANRAVARCYQQSLFFKVLIAEEVRVTEEINKEIKINNDMLGITNRVYDAYHKLASNANIDNPPCILNISKREDFPNLTDEEYLAISAQDSYAKTESLCKYLESIGEKNFFEKIKVGNETRWGFTQVDVYDNGGKTRAEADSGFDGIDVEEDLILTKISNVQEAITMHGDELTTNAQMANTRLSKLVQDQSAAVNVATQIGKDYENIYRNVSVNIRSAG